MSAVQFVQGQGSSGVTGSGDVAQVLPGDATPGDFVVLLPVADTTLAVASVESGIGAFDALIAETGTPWLCARAGSALGQASVTNQSGSGVWLSMAVEFGPNGGLGSGAYLANYAGGSAVYLESTTPSATVTNVTAGAAYVVAALNLTGATITGTPGDPWTALTGLPNDVGLGAAWVVAATDDPIQFSFVTGSDEDEVAMFLVEVLPPSSSFTVGESVVVSDPDTTPSGAVPGVVASVDGDSVSVLLQTGLLATVDQGFCAPDPNAHPTPPPPA